jgi:hypothetical protein
MPEEAGAADDEDRDAAACRLRATSFASERATTPRTPASTFQRTSATYLAKTP